MNLNTTNPNYITLQYEQLCFAVLGGIRLDNLDSLRATIRIEFLRQTIRHNLDLYNDTQVEKLIRKTAERFELGVLYVSKAMHLLINQLEQWKIEEMQKQTIIQETKKILTTEETEQATGFLKTSNLLQQTNDLLGKSGIIGEEHNRLLMYLIFTSRKRDTPLHILSLGASGMGKTYLQEKVSELIPEEDKIEITSLSENAFYYFGQQELKNKLIIIEDLDGAMTSLFPLRELQTKRRITKRISIKDNKGNTKTVSVTVEGPICVAGCTTKESIYEDNANRSFLIYLDESKEQDGKIMERQRLLSAGKINTDEEQKIKHLLQNCQRILQPVSIRNPFAEYLKIPEDVFKPRRTNAHYLQFIEAVTFYKQYQREQKPDTETGEVYIEATLEDIEEANRLIKEILLRKSDELNKACRTYFEYLKAYLKSEKKIAFTSKEIRQALKTNHSNQKRYMLMLLENNYIRKTGDKIKGFYYEVVSYEEYEKLKNNISKVLDDILEQLKEKESITSKPQEEPKKNLKENTKMNSSEVVHNPNEQPNEQENNNVSTKVQKFKNRTYRQKKNKEELQVKTLAKAETPSPTL